MDEESFNATVDIMSLIVGELTEAPLEDFIKQINSMAKNNDFNEKYEKDVMIQFLVLAQGLLNVKSAILLNFTAFEQFKG